MVLQLLLYEEYYAMCAYELCYCIVSSCTFKFNDMTIRSKTMIMQVQTCHITFGTFAYIFLDTRSFNSSYTKNTMLYVYMNCATV